MTDFVLLERTGAIAKVTLNQPAKLNAVNIAMWRRLRELFTELDADDGLRCVILAGAGERAFSVGADISEFAENRSTIDQARRYHERTHAAMHAIAQCRHPVLAQIRGLCVGGGLEITTVCDLRICGASARFGIPVTRLGLVVSYTELKPLLELIGPANALEILLEGHMYGADEALRMGLVNRVVPDAELDGEAMATAQRIADGAPLAARWHKKFTRRLLQSAPLSEQEMDESFHCFGTEDFRAGYQAFLAKTRPEFRGR
jgi:enoyl-CoA hydratase/carnithine racemase